MAILQNIMGQLGKVKFYFYSGDKVGAGIPYSPAYNPTQFAVTYAVSYDKAEELTVANARKKFTTIKPRTVTMQLFFDGTGASPSPNSLLSQATSALGINTVDVQIETFLGAAYTVQGPDHKPKNVMIVWGTFIMTGVLQSANVTYTMFEPDGRPLRATMDLVIEENIPSNLVTKLLNLLSPDLSKSITVKEGDTLPLLCQQEYNDASLYIKIAEVNDLKNYRKLKQGMELLFPPIDNLA